MNQCTFFDAPRAHAHTAALCYPRRVATRDERRAVRYVIRQFRALGLAWRRERFRVSHFPTAVGARLTFVFAALLVVLGTVVLSAAPLLAACAWGLAGFAVVAPWRLRLPVGEGWRPCFSCQNLVARLPDPPEDAPVRVIFMAHYDTKSQLLPTGLRVAAVAGGAVLCGVLAVTALLAAAGAAVAVSPDWLAAGALFLVGVLLINVTGNRSPGAVDNGSAVGSLLELARSWRPRPDAPADVLWVATGCEEMELNGARHFLKLHETYWKQKPTLLINLESVGAASRLYLAGETEALRLARQVADELGMTHGRLRVVGAGMDHEPFAARSLSSVSILGDVVRASWAMHTSRDNMDLVDLAALDRAGRLAGELAWRWAAMHQPATAD